MLGKFGSTVLICNHVATPHKPVLQLHHAGIANGFYFKRDSIQSVKSRPSSGSDVDDGMDGAIVCLQCRRRITSDDYRLEINQRHQHTFTNPAQLRFTIGCFSAAPGCTGVGTFTSAYTWFAGYQWQIALCSGCHEHLGWKFQALDHRFYGLILNRLLMSNR